MNGCAAQHERPAHHDACRTEAGCRLARVRVPARGAAFRLGVIAGGGSRRSLRVQARISVGKAVVWRMAALVVVLSLSVAGVAAAAESGGYAGVTSTKGLVRLTVKHDRVVYVSFTVPFFGADCGLAGGHGKISVPIRHDRFHVTLHAGHASIETVRLTGKFSGPRVSGTLSGTYGGPACTTGKTSYSGQR